MTEPGEEWECSKENIRPIQQGRKQKVLKVALTSQPKDFIQQQKQAFENELRTYSGSDPLSVWYKYIKWVEQNYPKGGREGHIKQLVTHCLSVLKDHTNYFDDDRFIDISLKLANLSEKPIEVYNNMYSSNIGCKSAKFFIDWAWELEQLGNLKKADNVLMEGLKRRAEPIENLQTYQKDFERRFVNKVKEVSDFNQLDLENERSAFSVLKPQKKNLAPVMRTGAAVDENKPSLILGRQQPQPRNSASSAKVPFKIYNSENVNPLPVQTMSVFKSTLNSEKSKENERRPSKWNTAKIKSHGVKTPSESNPDFKFHCDENDEQLRTPRSVPKTSNILSTRRRTPSPPIALFEPPDPLKKPMYPKNEVYGGAEEYSLEEIRAAKWLDKQRRAEQERLLIENQRKIEEQTKREEELKRKVEFLAKKVELLENQFTCSAAVSGQIPDASAIGGEIQKCMSSNENHLSLKTIQNHEVSMYPVQDSLQNSSCGQNTSRSSFLKNNLQISNNRIAESFINKDTDNTNCYNTEKIVRDLYNGTLSHTVVEDENKHLSQVNQLHSTKNECNAGLPFAFYFDSTEKIPESNEINSSNDVQQVDNSQNNLKGPTHNLPFAFYHDLTEKLPAKEVISLHSYTDGQNCSENSQANINVENVPPSKLPFTLFCDPTETLPISNKVISDENINKQHYSQNDEPNMDMKNTSHNKLPFTLFCDPTETINSNKVISNEDANGSNQFQVSQTYMKLKETSHDKLSFALYCDKTETMSTSKNTVPVENFEAEENALPDENSEENIENIPPGEYVQERNDRELAGILQPSKNVFFIPLEEQELDDDSEAEEDCYYQCEKPHVDETLIPPSNTEQFSAARFLASTPYVPKTNKSSYSEELDDKCPSKKNVSHDSCLSENLPSVRKDFMHEENAVSKTQPKSATEPELNTQLKSICYSRLPNVLSVIMETSTENYSKSSSSNSSASLTKSNNLDQYSSQHFSLARSHSKFEVQEPGNLSSVSEVTEKVNSFNTSSSSTNALNKKSDEAEMKLFTVDFDPFDQKIIQSLLNSVDMSDYRNVYCIDKSLRAIVKIGGKLVVGDSTYFIDSQIAEGAYAKVFKCFLIDSFIKKIIALKVCKKANEWEFYICNEIQRRLSKSQFLPDIRDSVMNVISAAKYADGMVLLSDFSDLGTLLDVVNFYKKQNSAIPEVIVMYFTLEILHIVSQLHKCNIIHGDIKPDNFLMKINDDVEDALDKMSQTKCLRLIDFGRAIDLNLFDKGICFTAAFTTNHFKCNEMKDNKPWVFQLDWYGVLSCIHTMLFSDYMVVKKIDGVWQIEKKFKRYWCTSLWEPLFNKLLNIPDCYREPDVSFFTNMIESKLKQNIHAFQLQFNRFFVTYSRKL